MKKLTNDEIIKISAGVIIVLVIGFGIYISGNKAKNNENQNNSISTTTQSVTSNTTTANKPKTSTTLLSGKCNFKITYPAPGARVSFPLTIKGTIDNSNLQKAGCSWNEAGALAGTAQLFYNFNNYGWKSPGVAVPLNISTVVASSSIFSSTLNFFNQGVGLPSGSPIKITLVEFNPLNAPNPDTFDFFVYLK